jgi:hypothetical protein
LRDGIKYRCKGASTDRDLSRLARIERLRRQLHGGPARLKPHLGMWLLRRRALTLTLRRLIIRERLLLLIARGEEEFRLQ